MPGMAAHPMPLYIMFAGELFELVYEPGGRSLMRVPRVDLDDAAVRRKEHSASRA